MRSAVKQPDLAQRASGDSMVSSYGKAPMGFTYIMGAHVRQQLSPMIENSATTWFDVKPPFLTPPVKARSLQVGGIIPLQSINFAAVHTGAKIFW